MFRLSFGKVFPMDNIIPRESTILHVTFIIAKMKFATFENRKIKIKK